MNVVKNKNFKENHDKLQKDVKKYSNNLMEIYYKFEAFYVIMTTLKETFLQHFTIKSQIIYFYRFLAYKKLKNIGTIRIKSNFNGSFKEFDKIFKNFAEQINNIIEPLKTSVLQKIKDIKKNINEKAKENNEIFININFKLEQEKEINKKKIEFEKGSKNKNSSINYIKAK